MRITVAADPTWAASDIATSADGALFCLCGRYGRGWRYGYCIGFSLLMTPLLGMKITVNADPTWAAADIATSCRCCITISVFAADMDGDGDMDILSASSNLMTPLLGMRTITELQILLGPLLI